MKSSKIILLLVLQCVMVSALASAQSSGSIQKFSPAASRIIPANAKIERVATGFKWTEGPVWIPAGYLLFEDIPNNRIMKWVPGRGVTTFMQPSGYLGTGHWGPETGANGLTLDPRGRLTAAGHAQRDVWRLETMNPRGVRTILADEYEGKRLNSPNDLVYGPHGALYFTDPPYGLPTQGDKDPLKQLKVNGVYRIRDAVSHKPGAPPDHSKIDLLISNLSRPNGIAFSPDYKYLYVDNSAPQKLWMRYRVKPDGTLADGKVFYDATSDTAPGAPDGMKLDMRGNIYSAGPGGVWIFSPAGKHLATIHMPERVGNLAWGGRDYKTLYICATTSVYRIRLSIPGIRP